MFNSNFNRDSGQKIIHKYLSKLERGTIFTINDLMSLEEISYTSIRSILVNLSEKKIIIRICRGVYCYPIIVDGVPQFPDIDKIIVEISKKNKCFCCPSGNYAKYLLGLSNKCPNSIIYHTSGKVKTINLKNGISVKLIPSKRNQFYLISSRKLMIAISYISECKGFLNKADISQIIRYLKDISYDRKDLKLIPSEIKEILKNVYSNPFDSPL